LRRLFAEPLRSSGVHQLIFVVHLAFRSIFGDAATAGVASGVNMLDEQQTLALLGWTLGSVCLGTFVLSALALH
jgi:hypothetical protein